jgi:RNA polymerase sigma-70 factor (ECF subfamily)
MPDTLDLRSSGLPEGPESPNESTIGGVTEENFHQLIGELRPRLHRYCARMTGSVIDGEDVVQDALLKAISAFPRMESLPNPEAWLFRIAHNAALDFLRHRTRHSAIVSEKDPDMIATHIDPIRDQQAAAASLRAFMRLPPAQRSSVVMKDVLGYSVVEVSEITGLSVPAIKSALQRGRNRLRELRELKAEKEESDTPAPVLSELERNRLTGYIERFNAHDFDAVRSMLAEDVRLDLVNRLQRTGRQEVSDYFWRYSLSSWHCAPGFVDRQPAVLMFDVNDPSGKPSYFVLLSWNDEGVIGIRDFLFARYAMDGAEVFLIDRI